MFKKWSQTQPGWSTTSEEYLNHVHQMQRMPTVSAVEGVSRYPNLHMIIKNKADYNQECGGDNESCNADQASDSENKDTSEKQDEVKKKGSPIKLHKWGNFKSI